MHATAPVANVLRAIIGELQALDGASGVPDPPAPVEDRLLTAQEVAVRVHTNAKWVYRAAAAGRLPFARHLSPGVLRFSDVGLRQWLARR